MRELLAHPALQYCTCEDASEHLLGRNRLRRCSVSLFGVRERKGTAE